MTRIVKQGCGLRRVRRRLRLGDLRLHGPVLLRAHVAVVLGSSAYRDRQLDEGTQGQRRPPGHLVDRELDRTSPCGERGKRVLRLEACERGTDAEVRAAA